YWRTASTVWITLGAWLVALLALVALYWLLFAGRFVAQRSVNLTVVPWGRTLIHQVRIADALPVPRVPRVRLPRLLGRSSVDLIDAGNVPGHPRGAPRALAGGQEEPWNAGVEHTGEDWGAFWVGPTYAIVEDLFGWVRVVFQLGGAIRVILAPPE